MEIVDDGFKVLVADRAKGLFTSDSDTGSCIEDEMSHDWDGDKGAVGIDGGNSGEHGNDHFYIYIYIYIAEKRKKNGTFPFFFLLQNLFLLNSLSLDNFFLILSL